MPGGDRTGPSGMGPMTGRGAGFYTGNNVPGFMNLAFNRGMGFGLGRGRGRGFGRGWGYGWANPGYPNATLPVNLQADELSALKNQAKYLNETLQAISSRINDLESGK